MGVSCEDYNQCQLTQPDLTPHTVRRNISLSHTHMHIMHSHSLSQSVCLSLSLSRSQAHTHAFSPAFCLSHTHRWMLGTITVSGQRDCHSTFAVWSVYCSHQHRNGRTSVYLCDSGCDSQWSVCVCVMHVCLCMCVFMCIPCLLSGYSLRAIHSLSLTF